MTLLITSSFYVMRVFSLCDGLCSFSLMFQGGLGPQGDKGFPGLAGPQVMISLGFVAYLQKKPWASCSKLHYR